VQTTKKYLIVILALFLSSTAVANEITVFEQVLGKGKHKIQFESYLGSTIGTIRLTNGWDGINVVERSSSAAVKVNGVIVFKPSDFNQTVESLARGIPLKPETNTIEIDVNGNPDSAIAITIYQTPSAGAASLMYSDGGELFVDDATSDIYGAGVLVPDGALEYASAITISKSEVTPQLPPEIKNVGSVINFGADGLTFNYPVYISLPYQDTNDDGVIDGTAFSEHLVHAGYYDEVMGQWESLPVVSRDVENNTITLSVNHFSKYAALAEIPSIVDQTTRIVPNDTIIVDGVDDEWPAYYIRYNYNRYTIDPPEDKNKVVCPREGGNLRYTYTQMDDDYVYVLLKVYDSIAFPDHEYILRVDYSEGASVDQSSIADAMIVVGGDNEISISNRNGDLADITYPEIQVASSGNAFELRLPKALFQNPSWFNVVGTEVRPTYTGNGADHAVRLQVHETYKVLRNCDSQFAYPGLMYFSAFTGDEPLGLFDEYEFYFRDQNGVSVQDDIVKSFQVFDPSGTDITGGLTSTPSEVQRAIYTGHSSNFWKILDNDVVGINRGAMPERELGDYSIKVVLEGASHEQSDDFVINQTFASTTGRAHMMPRARTLATNGGSGCRLNPWSGTTGSIGCWWAISNSYADDYTARPWLRSYDADGVLLRMIDYYQTLKKTNIEVTKEQLRWLGEGADEIRLTVMVQKNSEDYRSYSQPRDLPNSWWKPLVYPGIDCTTGC